MSGEKILWFGGLVSPGEYGVGLCLMFMVWGLDFWKGDNVDVAQKSFESVVKHGDRTNAE